MQTAILFPGQGSQTPGMRDRAAALRPDLVQYATECVGEDPFPRADEDTRFAQPAILVASLANWGALDDRPQAVVDRGGGVGLAGPHRGQQLAVVEGGRREARRQGGHVWRRDHPQLRPRGAGCA